MASSSVSQESLDREEYEPNTRRSRMRILRGRSTSHKSGGESLDMAEREQNGADVLEYEGGEHESPTRSSTRFKDKRAGRPNHLHKGKTAKDKRKLREKRRSTGVVHMPSTEIKIKNNCESTGDSFDDDDETKKNTSLNENIDADNTQSPEERVPKTFVSRRNKSPSDLEADLEDNQDYDSTVSQSETNLTIIGQSSQCVQPIKPSGRGSHPHDVGRPSAHFSNDTDGWSAGHTSWYRDRDRQMDIDGGKSVHFSQRSGPPYSGVSSSCKDGDSGDSKISSSNSSEGKNPPLSKVEELERTLDLEKRENEHLKRLLEEKDRRILELERQVNQLNKDVDELDEENGVLHQDNRSLLQIVSSLGCR